MPHRVVHYGLQKVGVAFFLVKCQTFFFLPIHIDLVVMYSFSFIPSLNHFISNYRAHTMCHGHF